jgi:hypothetical protein
MTTTRAMVSRHVKSRVHPIHMQSTGRFTEEESVVQLDNRGRIGGKASVPPKQARAKQPLFRPCCHRRRSGKYKARQDGDDKIRKSKRRTGKEGKVYLAACAIRFAYDNPRPGCLELQP